MNSIKQDKIPVWLYGFILIIMCFISRLPQLLSPYLLLDGDECILGLMAKHIVDGKEFPVFFTGQNYGFSLIENIFGAIGFKLFGIGAITLRVSLLVIWSIGILFFFRTFLLLTTKRNAFLITLLMVLIPAWALGSMKARGGYITAFTFTAIVIYLIIKLKESSGYLLSVILGLITGIIYLSRPFWLPGLVPVFFYLYIYKKNFKQILVLVPCVIITIIVINKLFITPSNE